MNPTGSRSRYVNYIVILVVVVISALLAKGFLKPAQVDPLTRLGGDVKHCLDGFWGHGNSQVQAMGTPAGATLMVDPALPPATRLRQQAWTHPLVLFVASRHSAVQVAQVEIKGVAAKGEAHYGDSNGGRRAHPGSAFSDPAHFEEARSEVLRRNTQLQLDEFLGQGKALVLVDVVAGDPTANLAPPLEVEAPPSAPEARPGLAPRQNRYEPGPSRSRRPSNESKVVNIHAQPQVAQIHARIVLQQADRVSEVLQMARGQLGIQEGRGDTLREFVLPPL